MCCLLYPFILVLKKLSVLSMLSAFSIWLKRQSTALLLFCNFRNWLYRTPKLGNNKEQNVYNKKAEDQPSPFLETNTLLFADSIVPRESSCQQEGEILLSSVGSFLRFTTSFLYHALLSSHTPVPSFLAHLSLSSAYVGCPGYVMFLPPVM